MDEARLKEIEAEVVKSRRHFDPDGVDAWLPEVEELIAALRDAWRERDELVAHVQRLTPVNEIVERADRAEAEVKQHRERIKLMQKNSEIAERILHREIERLQAVRKAAATLAEETCEDTVVVDGLECVTSLKTDYLNLCRALDATETPV